MFARMLAFLGACGLIIVLTGIIPLLPVYANGTDCTGSGCPTEDDGACKTSHTEAECSGTGCDCHTGSNPITGAATCACS